MTRVSALPATCPARGEKVVVVFEYMSFGQHVKREVVEKVAYPAAMGSVRGFVTVEGTWRSLETEGESWRRIPAGEGTL